MLLKFICLILVSFSVFAGELDDKISSEKEESKNFCLNKQSALNNEALAQKNPYDEKLVKLVALRSGLCDLISKKIIELDFAIDLFNAERETNIMKRLQEDQTSNREIEA